MVIANSFIFEFLLLCIHYTFLNTFNAPSLHCGTMFCLKQGPLSSKNKCDLFYTEETKIAF